VIRIRNRSPRRLSRAGMTLVELMVAISMFAVVTTVIFTFLTNSRASYSDMSARVGFQQGARAVLGLMSTELRTSGCNATGAAFEKFAVAGAQTYECRMDLDASGGITVTEPAEDVTYTYDAGNRELLRNSGGGAQVVLRGVTALDFRYFDADGAELTARPLSAANRARIRSVQIDITGTTDRGEIARYVTRVNSRNN
jgi:prepilin-type N-terminal cleavage/methylation domain-containing protein